MLQEPIIQLQSNRSLRTPLDSSFDLRESRGAGQNVVEVFQVAVSVT